MMYRFYYIISLQLKYALTYYMSDQTIIKNKVLIMNRQKYSKRKLL